MKAVGAIVAATVAVMGLAVKATFKWADELDSIQDIMGVTNSAAAALNFTLRKSGTDTEALTRGMTILEKGLVDAKGKLDTTGKSLKKWGIDVFDVNKKLKDQEILIGDITTKYASFATQQEKVNFLTEIFGRSGATLVDFFDTLAKEGGLDAVTKKVKAFGLAIDPNRYEQFNRSLEELKLIGLGLAVQFTEKVMPILERFLGWFSEFAQNPDVGKLLKNLDDFAFNILQGMADSIDKWVSGGGPEKFSSSIISWVDNIGTGKKFQSKAVTAIGNLLAGLIDAAGKIDWMGIADKIDEKTAEVINAHDWTASGDAFGDMFSSAAVTGLESKQSEAAPAIGKAINDWLLGATGAAEFGGWKAFFDAWGEQGMAGFTTFFTNLGLKLNVWTLGTLVPAMQRAGLSMAINLVNGLTGGLVGFYAQLVNLGTTIESNLTAIAKVFFIRALAWTQQMIQGFKNGMGGLINAIGSMVAEINKALKKIVTSFQISIGLPTFLGGASATSTLGGNKNTTNSGGIKPGRASGGPVIAGQNYGINLDSEWFIPNQNGRVEKKNEERSRMEIDYNRLGSVIATEVVKAMNNY